MLPWSYPPSSFCSPLETRYGEQKIAQFRTHDLTKELAYVSTQIKAKFHMNAEMI